MHAARQNATLIYVSEGAPPLPRGTRASGRRPSASVEPDLKHKFDCKLKLNPNFELKAAVTAVFRDTELCDCEADANANAKG